MRKTTNSYKDFDASGSVLLEVLTIHSKGRSNKNTKTYQPQQKVSRWTFETGVTEFQIMLSD
jgi:hypothetical protein